MATARGSRPATRRDAGSCKGVEGHELALGDVELDQSRQFVPTVYLYDNFPGGVGLSEPLWTRQEELVRRAIELVERCDCRGGCPACVGPVLAVDEGRDAVTPKALARRVLGLLLEPDAPREVGARMSVTPEKLRALRAQAGLATDASRSASAREAGAAPSRNAGSEVGRLRTHGLQPREPAPVRPPLPGTDAAPAAGHRGDGMESRPGPALPPGERLATTATAPDAMASLRRVLGVRERNVVPLVPRGPVDRSLPGEEIAPGLRLIETHVPYPAPAARLSLAFAKREDEAVDPRALLFFDTETTGLAGGTGTRAFMIGAADWHRHPCTATACASASC